MLQQIGTSSVGRGDIDVIVDTDTVRHFHACYHWFYDDICWIGDLSCQISNCCIAKTSSCEKIGSEITWNIFYCYIRKSPINCKFLKDHYRENLFSKERYSELWLMKKKCCRGLGNELLLQCCRMMWLLCCRRKCRSSNFHNSIDLLQLLNYLRLLSSWDW